MLQVCQPKNLPHHLKIVSILKYNSKPRPEYTRYEDEEDESSETSGEEYNQSKEKSLGESDGKQTTPVL